MNGEESLPHRLKMRTADESMAVKQERGTSAGVLYLPALSSIHTEGTKKGNERQIGIKESKLPKLSRLFNSPSSKC